MITVYTQVSGAQIGDELRSDPEEAMWALEAMAERPDELLEEIPQYIAGSTAEKVTAFLRNLADAIENGDQA